MKAYLTGHTYDDPTSFQIMELNGVIPVSTPTSMMRFCTRDSPYPGDCDPCVIPTQPGIINYSFEKSVVFSCKNFRDLIETAIPSESVKYITNIRVYFEPHKLNDYILVGKSVVYNQAQGIVGVTGYQNERLTQTIDQFYDKDHAFLLDSRILTYDFVTPILKTQIRIPTWMSQGYYQFPPVNVICDYYES